ncbi:allantoate amidohydrolase [soil metagenome]
MDLDAFSDEVLQRADLLGTLSDEPGRLTRTYLSPAMKLAQDHVHEWMTDAGMVASLDAVGNVIGRSPTASPRTFLVGSHIDTVPNAGKYDGVLGVLLGIAAAKSLRGTETKHRLDVIAFAEEEGVRFRFPYIGSLAVIGGLTSELLARTDTDGISVAEAIRNFGLNPDDVPKAAYSRGSVVGYLEAHIEQGPVLESKGLSLGVVSAIMGQTRSWFTFTGQAGHAGTLPMDQRRDALAAAAFFVTECERIGLMTTGSRVTVGSLTVLPGGTNVVPGEVRLSLDVRHENDNVRQHTVAYLIEIASRIATKRQVKYAFALSSETREVTCDKTMTARLMTAAAEYNPIPVPSGAGHDAVTMARVCPVAMLFLQSPGGISHHPDEIVRREDVRAALAVMVRFLEEELNR